MLDEKELLLQRAELLSEMAQDAERISKRLFREANNIFNEYRTKYPKALEAVKE
jgi:hypothetical protein